MEINELRQKLRATGVRYVLDTSYVAHAKRLRLTTTKPQTNTAPARRAPGKERRGPSPLSTDLPKIA